jgi:hypothetical protein
MQRRNGTNEYIGILGLVDETERKEEEERKML